MLRRWIASALIASSCVLASFTIASPPASAADSWEDAMRELEDELGVTRAQCDADWLGLYMGRCLPFSQAQMRDSETGRQIGYESFDAAEFAKRFSGAAGVAPSPAQLVGGGAAAATTGAAGMSAATAGQAASLGAGFLAGGVGLISVTGMEARHWLVDEETTDLMVTGGSLAGWLDGVNFWADGSQAFVQSAPAFLGSGSAQVLLVQNHCVGTFASNAAARACWRAAFGGTDSGFFTAPNGDQGFGGQNWTNWATATGNPAVLGSEYVAEVQHVDVFDHLEILNMRTNEVITWYPEGACAARGGAA